MEKFKYNYEYHKILAYKVLNCRKPGKVFLTFEDTLEIIKKLYRITDGIKQIVYAAGWQYDGHDSKYPAWFEVNHRLKRKQDKSANYLFCLAVGHLSEIAKVVDTFYR